MPTLPVPVIAEISPVAYSLTDIDIELDGSGSVPSAGFVIETYSWQIFHRPPGATNINCYLTNANTATPTLRYPGGVVGEVGLLLIVTDSNTDEAYASSYPFYYPTQNGEDGAYTKGPYEFVGPVKTQLAWAGMLNQAGLLEPANGRRGWFAAQGGYWDLVRKVNSITSSGGGGGASQVKGWRWAKATAGDVAADGSAGNPFNITSAAANTNPFTALPFIGPAAQAYVAVLGDGPSPAGYTIVLLEGEFEENLSFVVDAPLTLLYQGHVTISEGKSLTFAPAASVVAQPDLRIGPLYGAFGGQFRMLYEAAGPGEYAVRLKPSSLSTNYGIYLDGIDVEAIGYSEDPGPGILGGYGCVIEAKNSHIASIEIADALVAELSNSINGSTTLDVFQLGRIVNAALASVTVGHAPDTLNAGIYNSDVSGTFTGPAGSAQFDLVTAARFRAAAGSFAGGAGKADYLHKRIVAGNLTVDAEQIISGGDLANMTFFMTGTLDLRAPHVEISAYTDYTVNTDDGGVIEHFAGSLGGAGVWKSASGTSSAAPQTQVDGRYGVAGVYGTGGVVIETADNNSGVTVSGAELVRIRAGGKIATASVASGGTGYTVGDLISVLSGEYPGSCVLRVASVSAGVVTGVTVYQNPDMHIWPGGFGYQPGVLATSGAGTGLTVTVTIHGDGTATINAKDIKAEGRLTATKGGAASTEQGRVSVLLDSAATDTHTTGTAPETLWFTNIPINTLASDGTCIKGEIWGSGINVGAALRVKVGATVIAEAVISAVTSANMRIVFSITRSGHNAQIACGHGFNDVGAGDPQITNLVANDSSIITLSVEGESPLVPGDAVFRVATVELWAKT